jgi:hypothetical protein
MWAPTAPPQTPAAASLKNNFRSTFLFQMCDAPEMAVVTASAAWMLALAMAGDTPMAIRLELADTPNAMPSAPSTICAAKPIATKTKNIHR